MIPDKFGACVVCHKDLMTEKVINNEIKKLFLPEYSQMELDLDDGSKMPVCVCMKCKENYKGTPKENAEIMESVVEGWKEEIKNLPHWTDEKRDNYMKTYGKLKIVGKKIKKEGLKWHL